MNRAESIEAMSRAFLRFSREELALQLASAFFTGVEAKPVGGPKP